MAKEKFSFITAFNQLPNGEMQQIRRELKNIFGITTNEALLNRVRGLVVPRITEYRAVENLFSRYGIKNCWDK